MRLFDAHNHLQDERLAADLDASVAAARAAGVARMVCCGSSEQDWAGVAAAAARHAGLVVPSYGLHPWYARGRTAGWLDALRARLAAAPAAGVGEIGLDRPVEPRDEADQEAVFLAQLRLGRELGRPVSIHCRRAWGRLLECVEPLGPHPAGLLFHSFSGAPELAARLVPLGAFFSFSGAVTFSGNRRGRRAAAAAPGDRLLIESDAPDLAPCGVDAPRDPASGRAVNLPANLPRVLEAVAALRGVTPEEAARLTWENGERLFGGPARAPDDA